MKCLIRRVWILGVGMSVCWGSPTLRAQPFFAMDTAVRMDPEQTAAVLSELGYEGFGGRPATARGYAAALRAKRIAFLNGYVVASVTADGKELDPGVVQAVEALRGMEAALWLAISKVQWGEGGLDPASRSAEREEEAVVAYLRRLMGVARGAGVKVSLYPHAGFWAERVERCVRLARGVGDPDLGVTFNLCHWLKVEGSERDALPELQAAAPWLQFVTICGADTGDTRQMGWNRLIQPLGRGSYDVAAFLEKVRTVGFRGPVGFQGYGIQMDARELLRESMTAWKAMQSR